MEGENYDIYADESISGVTGPDGKTITPEELGMDSTELPDSGQSSTPGTEDWPSYEDVVLSEIENAKGTLAPAIIEFAESKMSSGLIEDISRAREIIRRAMMQEEERKENSGVDGILEGIE